MKLKFLLFLSSAALLFHCAGTQPPVITDENEAEQNEARSQWNEEFDPLSLADFKLEVPQRKSESDDVVSVDQLLRGNTAPEVIAEGQEIPGFRVQLISTRDQEEARSVMRNAVISFAEKVYRQYDNPYYKIRVGDFKSRYDASKLQEKAIELGFHEAWVVRAIIWDGPTDEKEAEATGENQ